MLGVLVSLFVVAVNAFFHISEILLMLKGLIPLLPADEVGKTTEGQEVVRSSLIFFAAIIGGGIANVGLPGPLIGHRAEVVAGQKRDRVGDDNVLSES